MTKPPEDMGTPGASLEGTTLTTDSLPAYARNNETSGEEGNRPYPEVSPSESDIRLCRAGYALSLPDDS